jgi:hypothetical protein
VRYQSPRMTLAERSVWTAWRASAVLREREVGPVRTMGPEVLESDMICVNRKGMLRWIRSTVFLVSLKEGDVPVAIVALGYHGPV